MFNSKELKLLPEDPILGLTQAFLKDTRKEKINLGVGAYRDAKGKPYLLNCVAKAEDDLGSQRAYREYLPIKGEARYIQETLKLLLGQGIEKEEKRCIGAQTFGGTCALRIGAELLKKASIETVFLPKETWLNHKQIFESCGLIVKQYPYLNSSLKAICVDQLVLSLSRLPKKSACLLQVCCHNPTGFDLKKEDWKQVLLAFKESGALPFFDFAYQGLAFGLEEDAWPVRLFFQENLDFFVASCFSKNLGLYGERAGFFAMIINEVKTKEILDSHLKRTIRCLYSSPTLHTARLVTTILQSKQLKSLWEEELQEMRARLQEVRNQVSEALFLPQIKEQTGLFSFIGLKTKQVIRLKEEFAIYIPENGRINLAGIHEGNFESVIFALKSVEETC